MDDRIAGEAAKLATQAQELATDASALFARNLLNFITPMVDKQTKALKIDTNDEVVKGTLVIQNGQVVHPSLTSQN